MIRIKVERIDPNNALRREVWEFDLSTSRGKLHMHVDEYRVETKRSDRATTWKPVEAFYARSKRRGEVVSSDEVPPLPEDVIAEVRERLIALISVTISLPE